MDLLKQETAPEATEYKGMQAQALVIALQALCKAGLEYYKALDVEVGSQFFQSFAERIEREFESIA